MANIEVHIPKGKIVCGFDAVIEIPVVDYRTRLPVDMGAWALEWEVRENEADLNPLISKTTGASQIATATSERGTELGISNDLARITLVPADTANSGTGVPTINGLVYHALYRTGTGTKVLLASGTAWITPVGGR